MTIGEIITKHFTEFSGMVRSTDVVIEEGNTYEDIFDDVMLTAMKKYKGEVDEKEGYEYIKKTLLLEWFFSKKRKNRDILVLSDSSIDIPVYPEE
ncbi:MAG: hypothetical protein VZR10_09880 [Methanobrevibacter sp.]|nr:hypothetical protein [Methanobrevibacter sp.]